MAIETELVTDQIVGSPLSDRLILAHRKAGNVIIEPFKEKNLQSSSYDVSLGRYYYGEQDPGPDFTLFNPYNDDHVQRVWGHYNHAELARNLMEKYHRFPKDEWQGISPDDEVILLAPGKTYLCHTEEFIGFQDVGTTMMKARSTLGRNFIEICKCAGWGDNGYINRWTMEITNNSTKYTIPLVVGTRVAQLVFFYTGETDRPYNMFGNYQVGSKLDYIMKNWKPENMLPKLTI